MASQAVVSKKTFCHVCTNQCGMTVEVAGDRIGKVRGDREHPLSKGYSCPKGRAIGELHHQPDALSYPMMRKHGELVRVSWDECLDDLVRRFERGGEHEILLSSSSL